MRIRVIIVMLIVFWASAIHAQDYVVLENDDAMENTFEDGVYAHLYTFMATEGDKVTISMNRLEESELDSYLILLDTAGAVLAVNDDADGILWNAQIADFEIPETGTYLVIAAHAGYILQSFDQVVLSGEEIIDDAFYEVMVYGNEPDSDFELDVDELLPDEAVAAEITKDNPVAYALFEADENDVLTISTHPDGVAVDTIMYLIDPEGSFIAYNDDGENVEQFYSALTEVEMPMDGTYLVMASGYGFYNAPDGDWENVGLFSIIME